MPKVPLSTITSGYGTVDALNANFNAIEAAFDNTLSRDGDTPNQMSANLDMNGFLILNQGNPVTVEGFNWEGQWLTATAYQVGDVVQQIGSAYICVVAHTSNVFATDLAALKWQLVAQANLPAQIGNSGKYLTTNGTSTSWDDVKYTPLGTGVVQRTITSKVREIVSVKDFGAVGDGVANDTAAFTAAANASKNVLVPDGNYYLASDVGGSGSFFTLYGNIAGPGSLGSNGMSRENSNVMAVGRNWDNLARGFQIGGGDTSYGSDGNVFSPDGHYSWTRIQPSSNESSVELVVYPTGSQGKATATIGTNQITRVSGTAFDSDWVGKKFYFGEEIYRVLSVTNANNLTVTTTGGGAVSFASTFTETYHVFFVQGSGLCNVSGNTVTRVSGDPFVVFLAPSYTFTINGSSVTVTSITNIDTLTISSSLSLTNVPYTFSLDINDQIATFRLQKMVGGDEENLSIFARYDGYWMHSLYAGAGSYRKIVIGAGERQPGILARQIVTQKNGDLCLGGDSASEAVRILNQAEVLTNCFQTQGAPTGFAPAWAARGVDANIAAGMDMKGDGEFRVTQDFTRTLFKAQGGLSSVNWLSIRASIAGSPVLLGVDTLSGDTNVDISLVPKGAGVVRMGSWTSSADVPINGYITIKDAAGNTRKIATIA